ELYAKCGADPMAFILALRRQLNPDAMIFVDVCQAEHWATEAFTVTQPRTYLNPADNQAMGWSIPASIGAQRVHPARQVATLTGHGASLTPAVEFPPPPREVCPVNFFVLDAQAHHYMQPRQKPPSLRTPAPTPARLDYEALARGFGVAYVEISSTAGIEAG